MRANGLGVRSVMEVRPSHQADEGVVHISRRRAPRLGCREEDDIAARGGERRSARRLAEHAFRAISHHRATQALSSDEGDPTWVAFVCCVAYNHFDERMVVPFSLCERALEILTRLEGPHAQDTMLVVAHRETLAALGAATREHGAATLGGHAGTEAVGLGTLTLVRLVRTLHG